MTVPFNIKLGELKQTVSEYGSDDVPTLGAALAYFSMLSLFPLLLVLIALLGYAVSLGLPIAENGKEYVLYLAATQLGKGSEVVANAIESVQQNRASAGLIGFGGLLLSAAGVFGQLRHSLNRIWSVDETKMTLIDTIKLNLFSMTMVLGMAFLLLISLALDSILKFLIQRSLWLDPTSVLWAYLTPLFLGVITMVVFAGLFKFMPQTAVAWLDVWPGAILSGVLWEAGKQLFTFYLARTNYTAVYGPLASVIALMVFIFYATQIFFIGAEWASVRTARRTKGVEEAKAETEIKKQIAQVGTAKVVKQAAKTGQAIPGTGPGTGTARQ